MTCKEQNKQIRKNNQKALGAYGYSNKKFIIKKNTMLKILFQNSLSSVNPAKRGNPSKMLP